MYIRITRLQWSVFIILMLNTIKLCCRKSITIFSLTKKVSGTVFVQDCMEHFIQTHIIIINWSIFWNKNIKRLKESILT